MITKTNFHVKYTEIDSLGIVHHSNYPKWFEAGKIHFLRNAGLGTHKLNELGFFLPLTEMVCNFKKPARFGDEITIITSLVYLSYVKAKFRYVVFGKSTGKMLATGTTTHVWTNKRLEPLNIEKSAPAVYKQLKQLVEPGETSPE